MALSEDEMRRIAIAFLATPQMRFITQLMQQQVASGQGDPNRPTIPQSQPGALQNAFGNEQYAALATSQRRLSRQVAAVARRNAALEQREADIGRRARLDALAGRFPGVVDLAEEHQRCLYSAGSDMTDPEFEAYYEATEQFAARAAAAGSAPPAGGMVAQQHRSVESEQYQAKISERSVEIYNASLEVGNVKTADQCWAEAEREISGAAV